MSAGRHATSSVRSRADEGVLSLEFALVVPVLFVLLLTVFQLVGTARDALVLQNAAREGARVAATHGSDAQVRRAVHAAADGRDVAVTVTPGFRRTGSLVHVELTVSSGRGPLRTDLTTRATARVEPVVRR